MNVVFRNKKVNKNILLVIHNKDKIWAKNTAHYTPNTDDTVNGDE